MKRILLDTNIYGRMIERQEADEMGMKIEMRKDIIIYGFDVVRKELRATSQHSVIKRSKFRLALLGIYDRVTQRHVLSTTSLVTQLAEDYYDAYSRVGGKIPKKDIINDFLIVACATIHELDIVVSDDKDTMRDNYALTSYEVVNKIKRYIAIQRNKQDITSLFAICEANDNIQIIYLLHYRMPQFIGYDAFGRLLA